MFEFKFTIIIRAYNSQEYIKKAIDSVISQSIGFKDNVEIIIVNDGSLDKTSEIVEEYIRKYPNNIKLINNEKTLGLSTSRNLAIEEAKGEFISFLGSEDYISKNTLESVFNAFNDNFNIDIIAIPIYLYENQNKDHLLNYKFNDLSDIHIDTNNIVLSDNDYNLNIYDEDLDDVLASPDNFNLHLFKDKEFGDLNTLSLDDEVILLDETYNLKLYEEDKDELILAGSGVNTINDTSIVNLNEYPQAIQLSASSAFFRLKSIGDIRFDENMDLAQDAVFINEILLKKPIICLISNAGYYMRKDSTLSYLNSSIKSKEYYNLRFKNFYFKLIENSINYYGHVLEFIQYIIAYDIQWLFDIDSVENILNNIEFKELYFNLIEVLSYINDEIILNQKFINQSLKAHILFLKHFKYDYLITKEFKFKNSLLSTEFLDNLANSKLKLSYQQKNLFKRLVKEDPLCIDIYKIENNDIYISGFYTSFFDFDFDFVVDIENTFESITCDKLEYPQRDYYALNCPYCYNHYFEVKIPLEDYDFNEDDLTISFRAIIDEDNIIDEYDGFINENSFDLAIDFSKSCKLSHLSKYQLSNEYISEIENNSIIIYKKSKSDILRLESKLLFKLFNKKEDWRSGVSLKLLYSVFKIFKSKSIWIFMDKSGCINNNAFTLYKYADSMDDGIKMYYVLDKNSDDFNEIKKIANVLENNSVKHKLITLFADKIITSNINKEDIYPFWEDFENFAGLVKCKLIFLEDKITKDIISDKFYRANNDLDLIVCGSDKEKESFLDSNNYYNFADKMVKVLGFPRFDNFIDKSKGLNTKEIVIMPSSREDISHMNKEEFIESEYFKTYNELLNNPSLIGFAKSKKYKFVFKPNKDIYRFIDEFKKHEAVEFDFDKDYGDIINNASLIITDYSSISFDFAYLKKPVIYYHFDKSDVENSYFNYKEMGFGEVIDNQKDLVDLIKDYIYMNCHMSKDYKLRVDNFFKFNDKNNCKRVYEAIKDL